MKSKLSALYLKFLAACMALLGFAACGDEAPEYGILIPEYGTLGASYKVTGRVVSDDNIQQPVKDIEVIFIKEEYEYGGQTYIIGDTTYTDKNGLFELNSIYTQSESIKIRFDDVDGIENGEFLSKSEILTFTEKDFEGADGWTTLPDIERDMGTIELTSKPTDTEE